MTLTTPQMRRYFKHNFPDHPIIKSWTCVDKITSEPPTDGFVIMKYSGYWCIGCTGDTSEINAWRDTLPKPKLERRKRAKKIPGVAIRPDLIQRVIEVGKLHERGYKVKEIACHMNITYNLAYNYRRKYLTTPEFHSINNTVETE